MFIKSKILRLRYSLLFVFVIINTLWAILASHGVSTIITDEDRFYIVKILEKTGNSPNSLKQYQNFTKEIENILTIQNSAFDATINDGQMPVDHPREPKDLDATDTAYCNDRARYIDKALRLYGFKTRYASLYTKIPNQNFIHTMLTRGSEGALSHAVVEVKTSRGWMVVDTRERWISLDHTSLPHSLYAMQNYADKKIWPTWSSLSLEKPYPLFNEKFHIIYGLYSRHGRFYPPYTPYIPDLDLRQFTLNFLPSD